MKFYISDVLRRPEQVFIFLFVTAPTVALLPILFYAILTSPPSKVLFDQAHGLVGNATSTSVMVCPEEKVVFVVFRSPECQRHVVNTDDTIRQWGPLLLKGYPIVADTVFIC